MSQVTWLLNFMTYVGSVLVLPLLWGVSLEGILSAGRWRFASTFIQHYLQSVSFLVADWICLGLLAVAQSVASAPVRHLSKAAQAGIQS